MSIRLIHGDCAEALREMDDASVHAVVCDPPYGLSREPDAAEVLRHWLAGDDYDHRGGGFMGKSWDSFVPGPAVWAECLRVLRPGGHLLAFAGTRTADLMGMAVRLAGFEVRDSIAWLYGQGFPKSHDVAKGIDDHLGTEGTWRQEDHPGRPGARVREEPEGARIGQTFHDSEDNPEGLRHIYEPASDEAREWSGWGTALKPSFEPIIVARKPFPGTVAANILANGTGAINIDACRIGEEERVNPAAANSAGGASLNMSAYGMPDDAPGRVAIGRWPANAAACHAEQCTADSCVAGCAIAELDAQSGERKAGGSVTGGEPSRPLSGFTYGESGPRKSFQGYGDGGGASRFLYCAKASVSERNAGLRDFEGGKNPHPTVKPIGLMRWLLRLVVPRGGAALDPFLGSGTTGCAAALEGMDLIGIERDAGYLEVARARVAFWEKHQGAEVDEVLGAVNRSERDRRKHADAGQMGLEMQMDLEGEAT